MEIQLSNGAVTIDDEDWARLNGVKMWVHRRKYKGKVTQQYVRMSGGMLLHRFLMNPPKGKITDHKNGNGLDNRKNNLRIVDNTKNLKNRKIASHNTTGFKWVSLNKRDGTYAAEVASDKKRYRKSGFGTAMNAYLWAMSIAKIQHGDFFHP